MVLVDLSRLKNLDYRYTVQVYLDITFSIGPLVDWRYSPGGADIARAVHLDLTHFLLSYVPARFPVLISCFFLPNIQGDILCLRIHL